MGGGFLDAFSGNSMPEHVNILHGIKWAVGIEIALIVAALGSCSLVRGVPVAHADQQPANGVLVCQQITVSTGTAIPTTALSGRKSIVIQNTDAAKSLFLGGTNTVSSSNGLVLTNGQSITMTVGPIPTIFGTSSAGSLVAGICELS